MSKCTLCDCTTCQYNHEVRECGNCYTDSLEQCESGGIHNCRGYVPNNFFKRLWCCITGKLEWWQL